jgi:hypothetical protein
MRLKLATALVLILPLTGAWPAPRAAEAQVGSRLAVLIQNLSFYYATHGYTKYHFRAQVLGEPPFLEGWSSEYPLRNLTLVTDCGDIVFDHAFDPSLASNSALATLVTDLDCPAITIVRAHARFMGTTIDLTDYLQIVPSEIVPMEILKR